MRWITREKIKVDRVACPWLIRKFVDPGAEFVFLPRDTDWTKVRDVTVFDERDACLAAGRVDQEDAAHGGTPCAQARSRHPPDGKRRNRAASVRAW